jgi:hypothetical protein
MDASSEDIICDVSGKVASKIPRSSVNPFKKKIPSTNTSPAQSILRNPLASVCGSQGSPALSKQNTKPGLDKPIILKKGHCYDLRLLIKKVNPRMMTKSTLRRRCNDFRILCCKQI